MIFSEKFIQETERSLLENPYKLDKQIAALDQLVHEAENPAKRQPVEVISYGHYTELNHSLRHLKLNLILNQKTLNLAIRLHLL